MPKPTGKKKWSHRVADPASVGAGSVIPDGRYKAKIVVAEDKESADGNPYIGVQWKILGPKAKGAIAYDNFSLLEQALWKIRNLYAATDREWPSKAFDLGPDDFLDYEANIEIINEKYEGRNRPRVSPEYYSADEPIEGSDDDDDDKDNDKDDDDSEKEDSDDKDEKEEEERPSKVKKKKTSSESSGKLKVGSKVKFKDDDGNTVKGVITELDGDSATVEDSDDESWEVPTSDLTVI